jgi:hypothetical protein
MSCTVKQSDLDHFTGSEHMYYHWAVHRIHYTDGVEYLNANGAAWLVDLIALKQTDKAHPEIKAEPFQLWKLELLHTQQAAVICEDGNGKQVYRYDLDFTDFPFPIKLYFTDNTILLTSEY